VKNYEECTLNDEQRKQEEVQVPFVPGCEKAQHRQNEPSAKLHEIDGSNPEFGRKVDHRFLQEQ